MQGLEAFLSHVPELRGARGPLTFLFALALFAAANAAMIVADGVWPEGTLATQLVVLLAGFFTAAQFFWRRNEYKQRGGAQAYWRAFSRHIVPGLPLMFAVVAHTAYLPGPRVITGWAGARCAWGWRLGCGAARCGRCCSASSCRLASPSG